MNWFKNSVQAIATTLWRPEQFLPSLKYMWQGMLCIFVVIGVIVLSVYFMGYLSSKAAERKKAKDEDNGENE